MFRALAALVYGDENQAARVRSDLASALRAAHRQGLAWPTNLVSAANCPTNDVETLAVLLEAREFIELSVAAQYIATKAYGANLVFFTHFHDTEGELQQVTWRYPYREPNHLCDYNVSLEEAREMLADGQHPVYVRRHIYNITFSHTICSLF